jgi:hypothetical protein
MLMFSWVSVAAFICSQRRDVGIWILCLIFFGFRRKLRLRRTRLLAAYRKRQSQGAAEIDESPSDLRKVRLISVFVRGELFALR